MGSLAGAAMNTERLARPTLRLEADVPTQSIAGLDADLLADVDAAVERLPGRPRRAAGRPRGPRERRCARPRVRPGVPGHRECPRAERRAAPPARRRASGPPRHA